ncbi:hypothetical protein [Methanobrevibacter sp. YE315]|uniref:hypothetical protein n=1 Tax=Methanobrevibacter sp. YE315 TaxID=1609968 RepID=UPI0012DCAC11|nr:hypothetical protein [Methanobrevibacter sp. YE315]
MLDNNEKNRLMEKTKMLINPRDEYYKNQGIKEGKLEGIKEGKLEIAIKLLNRGMPMKEITKLTGLNETQIQNAK